MTTIALYNIKGGVGKTAGCVNLAYQAAAGGKKTLVWDLDPQGSASFYFQVEAKLKGSVKKMLAQDVAVGENIHPTSYKHLDLLPAGFSNRHLDVLFDEMKQSKKRMRALLAQLENNYDYLFIDCPPGIGPLSEAVFSAADFVLAPSIPTTLSLRTFDMIHHFFSENNIGLEKLHCYFSMVDVRKTMHNDTLQSHHLHPQFLKAYIPYLSTVEKMGEKLAPVAAFAPSSYAAQCFAELWHEFKKNVL